MNRDKVRSLARSTRVGTVLPLGATIRLYGDTDKHIHQYTQWYEKHLRRRRHRRNRVLEIGVGGYDDPTVGGGSLRVWRDYLPLSRVVGFDIEPKELSLGSRVGFVQGDQSSETDLQRAVDALGGPPDVVIDDGSHLVDHALASFRYLFPLMPSGGLYVVEDLSTSYSDRWGGGMPAPETTAVGMAKTLVDAVQTYDPTWQIRPDWGPGPDPVVPEVATLHVYPGIFFLTKR